jgi:hypothetical protein
LGSWDITSLNSPAVARRAERDEDGPGAAPGVFRHDVRLVADPADELIHSELFRGWRCVTEQPLLHLHRQLRRDVARLATGQLSASVWSVARVSTLAWSRGTPARWATSGTKVS